MEAILHHLGFIKPCKEYHINLCRISSINRSFVLELVGMQQISMWHHHPLMRISLRTGSTTEVQFFPFEIHWKKCMTEKYNHCC